MPPPSCSSSLFMKPSAMLLSLVVSVLFMASLVVSDPVPSSGGTFNQNFDLTWGGDRAKIYSGGQLLSLTLDRDSGSGFQSKKEYLFGRIDMQLKLIPGDSAGTVTAYYLSSQGLTHDEIDFEFLGNLSGNPYTVHTNIFTQAKGNREMQFHLWFDPAASFHTYSIVWNPQRIIFMVDNTPIREFVNLETQGVPFPNKQPMRLYSSLWNADDWATQGGRVKTDWSKAPFTAYFCNFVDSSSSGSKEWQNMALDPAAQKTLKWVQDNYMIYNYCIDYNRFPEGLPQECNL